MSTAKDKIMKDSHVNFDGGPSFDVSPLVRLKSMAASCFFGEPSYYKSRKDGFTDYDDRNLKKVSEFLGEMSNYEWRKLSPASSMEKAIDEALAEDLFGTMEIAAELRNEDNIRLTPQIILVRAANFPGSKGTGVIRRYARQIIQRPDDITNQMEYQLRFFGSIPSSLKRSWSDFLERQSEYSLAKYRMSNRDVKLVDVVNMCHAHSENIDKLMRGELKLTENNNTWESVISNGGGWRDALEVMGHMALLRNLRNLLFHGVNESLFLEKLVNGAENGKQLPFRYYSAYKALNSVDLTPQRRNRITSALEECMIRSMKNLSKLDGFSLILSDNSGSAQRITTSKMGKMKISTIGNLMGVITGMISDSGKLGIFGDRIDYMNISAQSSIFDLLNEAEIKARSIGTGTENGIWLALDNIIRNKIHVDNLFVYSDMQAGHGGLFGTDDVKPKYVWKEGWGSKYIHVPKLISEYRAKVNSDVNVFLVQTAGYEDTIIPEFFYRTYILGGWSDGILKFASKMIKNQ